MNGRIVGIDLGTTNSEVAVVTEQGVVVLEEDGTALLPSVVGLSPTGQILVGREALHQAILHPDRTIRSVKRLMGTETRIALGHEAFVPQEISALILGALRDRAERHLGERVAGAVITVPAYFSDAQRQATREAGEIAGLEVHRILNEPTAASLAYPATTGERRTCLVYDLGGGTFDVSIVRQEMDVTEVLATNGDTHLGGDDFDLEVVNRVLDENAYREHRSRFEQDPHVRARLLRAAEAARCRLSSSPRARIREDSLWVEKGVAHHLDREIDRDELEAWLASLIEGTVASVQRALEDAGLDHRDLDDVLLAGGTTRMPAVRRLIQEATGRAPSTILQPDTCVALGAGLVAARLEGRSEASVLVDVTPYTFGTRVVEFEGLVPDFYRFVPLIRRNTPLPVAVTEAFQTCVDGQAAAHVEVLQGEDPDARNNIPVGDFHVEGLADVERGNEIQIGLSLGVDGILEVTATERDTGLTRQICVAGALGRLGERDLTNARARVAGFLGREENRATRAPGGDEAGEGSGLTERCRRLLDRMAAEDRAEAEELLAALADPKRDGEADELRLRLEDILFYVGESEA